MLRRFTVLVVALALIATACTDDADQPTTTSTTTVAATTTSTLAPDAPVDDDVAREIRAEIDELIVLTEEIRGLPFLTEPEITVLNAADLSDRVAAMIEEDIDREEIERADALNTLLGMMDEDEDLMQIFLDVYSEQVAGFYDGGTGELVVRAKADGLSPLDRSIVVHELVHALTDQHFQWYPTLENLGDTRRFEEAAALRALLEGDATYFQIVYLESLSVAEQFALATEALEADTSAIDAAPEFIEAELAFPYNDGYLFTLELVDQGGIAAVDQAYVDIPVTTEQILHPDRYVANDDGFAVSLPPTSVSGWTVVEDGVFGELGLQLLLLESVPAGDITQASTGWRGDAYRVLTAGDDVAIVLEYLGETERDAIELTEALIDHIRRSMDVGDGLGDGAGLLFEGETGYVFLDREEDALTFIASTDAAAGAALRSSLDG
ncbi:MAG: hypothetical protein KJO18_04610 [Acidimicrobiia bacterium]|nr:hypothetical protein [Acidimicrobiia bacterium]NNC75635.1 hypothetical protein [Acidimicrobiia bacterium]